MKISEFLEFSQRVLILKKVADNPQMIFFDIYCKVDVVFFY